MRRPRPVDRGHDPHQHAGARGGAAPGKRARTDRLPPTPGLAAPAPGGHAFYPMPGEGSVGAARPSPVGQVWATFNRYTGFRVKEYLHARGTGRSTWLDESDRQRGIDAGIEVVLDELAGAEVKVP